MKIQIVKKKASSLRELGRETVEITPVNTLRELLTELVKKELRRQTESWEEEPLSAESIRGQSQLGRVSFGTRYNEAKPDEEAAIHVMIQDFEDGLFRVFINRRECQALDEVVSLQENDEVVFIRLVMLAGRMW